MRLTRSQTSHKKLSCFSIVLRTVQAVMGKNVSQAPPGELPLRKNAAFFTTLAHILR